MINFIYVLCLVAQSCPILCNPTECSLSGSPVHGGSPGKNTGVGCHALCQGIFPAQGLNPGLLHCRRILYPLRHQGSPNLFIVGQREREKVCVCVCVCVCACARAQSCPTLCNPMDCSLPGSSDQGIFQASILEWVAISYARGYS